MLVVPFLMIRKEDIDKFDPRRAMISMRFIFFGLLGGMLAFLFVLFIMRSEIPLSELSAELSKIFVMMGIGLAALGAVVGIILRMFTRRKLNTLDPADKAGLFSLGFNYMAALALCEGTSLVSGIFYMLCGRRELLVTYIAMLVVMFIHFPVRSMFIPSSESETMTIPEA